MKLDKFLLKVHEKIVNFTQKFYGDTKKSNIFIELLISMFFATNYYYYIVDIGITNIIAYMLTTIGIFILLNLGLIILVFVFKILKLCDEKSILLFIVSVIFTYELIDSIGSTAGLDEYLVVIISFIFVSLLFILVKSCIGIKNKKKFPILTLIPMLVIILGTIFFALYDHNRELTGLEFVDMKEKELKHEAIYASEELEYNVEEGIDLSDYVSYSDKTKKVRDYYFKTDLSNVPIKGKVYLPTDKNDSPLVVFVHGNHRMTKDSYLGYDYLGKYLARRGIAMISIDMNVMNGFLDFGLSNENDARAILMLENLKYVLSENKNSDSKLYGKIDEKNIIMGGHSRGGEAAAIATSFNSLDYNPDNGEKLDYKFNIKGVLEVAPTYDQYSPASKKVKLKDVNFLTLQGTHDADVDSFQGMSQYKNILFSKESNNFKSAIYIGYANHSRFNEMWGGVDKDFPKSLFIEDSQILDYSIQKEIAGIFTYEFAKNTFGLSNDRDLFINTNDYKLPETLYYSRYLDSNYNLICDYEEDYDLSTFKYGKITFNGLKVDEYSTEIGYEEIEDSSANFSYSGSGYYEMSLNQPIAIKEYLTLDIKSNETEEEFIPGNFTIILTDKNGNISTAEIENYKTLYPKVRVEISKLNKFNKEYGYYSSFQSVKIPIQDFNNGTFNPNEISGIKFDFNGEFGSLAVDNIGFK